jgi:hypothetical protein
MAKKRKATASVPPDNKSKKKATSTTKKAKDAGATDGDAGQSLGEVNKSPPESPQSQRARDREARKQQQEEEKAGKPLQSALSAESTGDDNGEATKSADQVSDCNDGRADGKSDETADSHGGKVNAVEKNDEKDGPNQHEKDLVHNDSTIDNNDGKMDNADSKDGGESTSENSNDEEDDHHSDIEAPTEEEIAKSIALGTYSSITLDDFVFENCTEFNAFFQVLLENKSKLFGEGGVQIERPLQCVARFLTLRHEVGNKKALQASIPNKQVFSHMFPSFLIPENLAATIYYGHTVEEISKIIDYKKVDLPEMPLCTFPIPMTTATFTDEKATYMLLCDSVLNYKSVTSLRSVGRSPHNRESDMNFNDDMRTFDFHYFGKDHLDYPSPKANDLTRAYKVVYDCLVKKEEEGYWVINNDENTEVDTAIIEQCKAMNVLKNEILSTLTVTSLVRLIRQ